MPAAHLLCIFYTLSQSSMSHPLATSPRVPCATTLGRGSSWWIPTSNPRAMCDCHGLYAWSPRRHNRRRKRRAGAVAPTSLSSVGCSCPKGSPGGHRTPEPPPQRTLWTRTSSRAARPAALHMATTARRLVLPSVSRGACGLFGIPRKYLEGHFRPVRPTPAPPSHTNLQIRPNSRCWSP